MTEPAFAPLQWLVACQMGLYGLVWAFVGLLLRDTRRPLMHWGAFFAMLGFGLALASGRDEPRHWLYYNGANVVSIVAFALMRRGTEMFMKVERHDREQLAMLAPVIALIVAAGPADHWATLRIVLSYAAQAYTVLRTMVTIREALATEFGRPTMLAIVVPGGLIGVVLALLGLNQALQWAQPIEMLRGFPSALVLMGTYLGGCALLTFSFMVMIMQRLIATLREASVRDALTGLHNRRAMTEALGRQWQRHRRTQSPLAVVAIDLDHFKRINDTLGQTAGDSVLVHLSNLLQNHVRAEDIVGRVGGEEFLLLLPDTEPQQATALAERLRVLVRAEALGTTISVGVALAHSVDKDPESLIARADAALYRAKEAGRNRVEVAD
ncbi:GGDEF domain-containing protein [Aquincola sp. S2]|uniref:diguanylate cyclase n=1 Tax=Pseudaquabacterium terrae TaxID=2732868 RepID=A0ABX2EDA4_9BURK|nr:GGDEF domain-containing protein [Aquabacterium terrae]NRF66073.1 GGDEF domain-containing protein [Aquabacterium terrae]